MVTASLEEDRFIETLQTGIWLHPFFDIPDRPKRKILELGAGTGANIAIPLALRGHDVSATECSDEALEYLKKTVDCHHARVRILHLDFHHLRLPKKNYDYIFALKCLQHHPSFKRLERTLIALMSLVKRQGEHRFMFLTDEYKRTKSGYEPVNHIARNKAESYIAFLERVYADWKVEISIEKNGTGSYYENGRALKSKYNTLFFKARKP